MLTNNFRNAMALVLEKCTTNKGLLPVVAYNGTTYYMSPSNLSGLNNPVQTLALDLNANGISLGTGTSAPSVADYALESQITSGISANITQSCGLDDLGNPYQAFDITISNSSGAAVTIAEIGYRQNLYAATTFGGTGSNRACLLDRTLLDDPVTIADGGIGVVRYTLKTILP